jgi:uncharacterized phage-associated protein
VVGEEWLVQPQVSGELDVAVVASYFIAQDSLQDEPDVTPMKLQKLLYLTQANWLASTGQRLFDEPVEAYEHGPVVTRAWTMYSGREVICLATPSVHSVSSLPADVEEFLEQVWVRFRGLSASALRNLTHQQAPWRDNYRPGAYRTPIPDAEIAGYFRTRIPPSERVVHPNALVVSAELLDSLDEDHAARALTAFLTG